MKMKMYFYSSINNEIGKKFNLIKSPLPIGERI
jgi:hypothetical protein